MVQLKKSRTGNHNSGTDMSVPTKRCPWWIVLLMISVVVAAGTLIYRTTHLEQWSWFWASRGFVGQAIDATSKNDIYVVGNYVLHYDGIRWSRSTPAQDACDDCGPFDPITRLFRKPTIWKRTCPQFDDVEVYDATHVYAVGAPGFWQYDGTAWVKMPVVSGLKVDPYLFWVQRPDSIYAVEIDGGVLHWDGQVWDVLPLPVGFEALAVGGTDEHVVISGLGPTLLLETDGQWEPVDVTSFVEQIQPYHSGHEYDRWAAQDMWTMADGSVLVEIVEYQHRGGYSAWMTRALLSYRDDTWSLVMGPQDPKTYWQAYQLIQTPQGTLGSYNEWGYRDTLVQAEDDPDLVWQSISEDTRERIWGAVTFLGSSDLIVYGGQSKPSYIIDALPQVAAPCTIARYHLEW